jgi:hypothetical protein
MENLKFFTEIMPKYDKRRATFNEELEFSPFTRNLDCDRRSMPFRIDVFKEKNVHKFGDDQEKMPNVYHEHSYNLFRLGSGDYIKQIREFYSSQSVLDENEFISHPNPLFDEDKEEHTAGNENDENPFMERRILHGSIISISEFTSMKQEIPVADNNDQSKLEEEKEQITANSQSSSSKSNDNPSTVNKERTKKYEQIEDFDVETFVKTLITAYLDGGYNSAFRASKGRPKKYISIQYANLVDDLIKELNAKISNSKAIRKGSDGTSDRNDASKVSARRRILKIPDYFLKKICRANQYKNSLKNSVKAYLESFLEGFAKVFKLPDGKNVDELFEYFIGYIILCFPKDRVTLILNLIRSYSRINHERIDYYKSIVTNSKETSSKWFKRIHMSTPTLKLICEQLPTILSGKLSNRKLDVIMEVIHF